MQQSHELAAHIISPKFHPKPFRVYSSPFYRCLQTIQPSVEELKKKHQEAKAAGSKVAEQKEPGEIELASDFDVRIENGLG